MIFFFFLNHLLIILYCGLGDYELCSSAFENVPYSLENYTVKNEQFDQLKKILQFVLNL